MKEGWIALHRKIQDCEIWSNSQPFDMRSAWIDLILLANHRDANIVFDYKPMTVKRGQYLTSVRKLGIRWSWSKNRTLKFLRLLEELGMVHRESNNQRTLLTIVNYSDYQDVQDTNEDTDKDTGKDTKRTQSGHGYATNNNENNENNNNIYTNNILAFSEFWKNYPRKQDKGMAYKKYLARLNDGYTEDELLIACKNYAAECEREKRDKKYIKVASTFLSVNEPFAEYLNLNLDKKNEKGGKNSDDVAGRTREDEEQHNAEIDKFIKSDEFRSGGELPFV